MYTLSQMILCAALAASVSAIVSNVLWVRECKRMRRSWTEHLRKLRDDLDAKRLQFYAYDVTWSRRLNESPARTPQPMQKEDPDVSL